MLKKILLGLAVFVALVFIVGLALPSDFAVERSAMIAAPPERVFQEVNSLQRWPAWSPWIARDPSIQNTYSGPAEGVGATVTWTSDDSGEGTQTITVSDPPKRIETKLDFGSMGTSKASWTFSPEGNGTKVTWTLQGDAGGPLGGYFAMKMDDWVGADYEDGLARLKRHVEGGK